MIIIINAEKDRDTTMTPPSSSRQLTEMCKGSLELFPPPPPQAVAYDMVLLYRCWLSVWGWRRRLPNALVPSYHPWKVVHHLTDCNKRFHSRPLSTLLVWDKTKLFYQIGHQTWSYVQPWFWKSSTIIINRKQVKLCRIALILISFGFLS